MAGDFNSKISTIRQDLDALLGTIRNVETELHDASASFTELAANAKSISSLSAAIQKLSKFLDSNKSPFLDEIKDRVKDINTELSKLNVRQLETATTALEANAKAMAAISRAQANTNRNLENAKQAITSVRSELSLLEQQAGQSGNALEGSVGRIEKSLQNINQFSNIGTVVGGLNQLDPTKYGQAADALDRVLKTVEALKRANISIDVSAATEGQKLAKRPITPVVQAPTIELPADKTTATAPQRPPRASARTVQYAQDNNIDLTQVAGTGARGAVTKEDVLRHKQTRAADIPTAAPVDSTAKYQAALEDAQARLSEQIISIAQIDQALEKISDAKLKAIVAAGKQHGLKNATQFDIAQKYLAPEQNVSTGELYNRRKDFEEIRINKSFDDLGVGYLGQLNKRKVNTDIEGFDEIKLSDTALINQLTQTRAGLQKEIDRTLKEISKIPKVATEVAAPPASTEESATGPSFSLRHTINAVLGRKDEKVSTADVSVTPEATSRVQQDRTGAFYSRGNKRVGATADEASESLAAINKAVDASPHKIAVVTTVGSTGGGSSLIPGESTADHILLAFRDLTGELKILEHLGDRTNLAEGNRTGSVAFGAYAPERRTPEEVVAAADAVRALPLKTGTPEQAQTLLQSQARLTEPGKSVYSFASQLNKSDLVAIGETCASATARAFKDSGILTDIKESSRFANVPGTKGLNIVTPQEVLNRVANAQQESPAFSTSQIRTDITKAATDAVVTVATKANTLKQDAILALPTTNGIAAQYGVNNQRGLFEGAYQGPLDNTAGEARLNYRPTTGAYSSTGNKIGGATQEDASATRLAVLKALADSEHGIAIVGVAGRSAGGKSASNYGVTDPNASADHLLVAYLEDNIVKIGELLATFEGSVSAKNVHGEDTTRYFHPGSDDFETVFRTWDRAHAVPVNGLNDDQAEQFKTGIKDRTQPGAAYGLEQSFSDAGELIGDTCVSVIAKAGASAGLFKEGYGNATSDGKNVLHPSALLKLAEGKNEEYRRANIGKEGPISVEEASDFVQGAEANLSSIKAELPKLIETRTRIVTDLLNNDKELLEDLQSAVQHGSIPSIEHFVKTQAEDYSLPVTSATTPIYNALNEHGVGNRAYYDLEKSVSARTQPAQDLVDIGKAALDTAQRKAADDATLQATRPTTSVHRSELYAQVLTTGVETVDAVKRKSSDITGPVQAFVAKFSATLKDIFSRIGATFDDLFTSVKGISVGDVVQSVRELFKAPTAVQSTSTLTAEAGPAFSLKESSEKFSKNVYRPFSYGVSQFGAGLNSVREISGGIKEGGAGGLLDVLGGLIKLLHTVSSSNAYFGLNLLPKGVGQLFNQRRSDTLLDIAETGVGLATGYRRSPVDRTFRQLAQQEAPLAERVATRRSSLETAQENGASDDVILALRQELEKDTAELKRLRSQINAYRIVISREAEEESHRAQSKSTGADLDENAPALSRPFQESANEALNKVKPFITESQSLLSKQATDSLLRFSNGTGLQQGVGGGVAVVSQRDALNATRQFYSAQSIGNTDASQIQGLSAPILDELGKRVSSLILTTTGSVGPGQTKASVLVHEATHELIDQSGRDGKSLYTGTTQADLAFADPALEQQRTARLAQVNAAGEGGARADYLFDPREAFAHIGEALVTGSKEIETELRQLYGDNLYNDVVKTLESTLPNTFAPQYLSQLQAKFVTFNSEIDAIFSQGVSSDTGKHLGDALTKILSGLQISPDAGKGLGDKLQKLFPAVADTLSNSESLGKLYNAATPLFTNEGSFKNNVYQSFKGAGGQQLVSQAFSALQNPNEENVNELIKGAKTSPDIIKKAITSYVTQALSGDPVQGLYALGTLKRGPGAVVGGLLNQFAPEEHNFRDQANEQVQKLTGRNLKEGTYQQSSAIDAATGVQHFTLSAQSADGAVISLNGHIDEFGQKKLDEPAKAVNRFAESLHQVTIGALRQIGDSFTYGLVNSFQEMFRQLVGIQDELGEVANLLGVVGDQATQAKSKFLFQSVGVAVKTGQGFDEAIQTNLKNFKILGSVKDPTQREDLANQVSEVQLGAQTAFGISLEQSLESIPAILATIKDGMSGIDDPAKKVTASIETLRDVMDQVVIAQRTTGAQGDELLTVYSRLAASAKEYGLNSKQLLGITATSSVAIGKGSDETSNILRSFLEGTYSSANQSSFAKNGIATQQFNENTNQLENRSFEDVLKDLYKLSQDKSKSIDYNQLLQSIGGPRLAPDISKVIQGFGNNYADVEANIDKTPKGVAQQLVQQKSQNFAGSLNKLEATGTQFLGSLLVGTGGFDSAAKLFDTLSESAVKLTGFLNDNEGSIKKVVNALAPFVKFFTVGLATKDLNIFAPLAKGIGGLETKFSGTFAKITDFGKVGESSTTRVQKVLNLLGVALEELDAAFLRTGATGSAAFAKVAESATVATKVVATEAAKSTAAPAFALAATDDTEQTLNSRLGSKGLNTSGITESDLAQIRGQQVAAAEGSSLSLRGIADDVVATAGRPSRLQQLREGLKAPGAAAGALAAPVAFDLLSGGLGKDNLVSVGAGIAGGIAGAFVGGPLGATVGYSISKGIADSIDLAGKFGTSEREAGTFAEKIAEAVFNKAPKNGTPEQQQADKNIAAGQLEGVGEKLGVNDLTSRVSSIVQGSILNRGRSSQNVLGTSADDVKAYLEFQSKNGGRGPGFTDNFKINNADTQSAINVFGGNKQLLDLFAGSGLSSIQEFVQQLDQASHGVGPLSDAFTKLSVDTRQQAISTQAVIEADTKRAQYESAQDLIQRGQQQQSDLESKLQSDYQTPYGLDKYNAFSPESRLLDSKFAPDISKINAGQLTGQDAQSVLDRMARSQESLASLPQTLQQLLPLAQSLGQNTTGLDQKLYGIGSQGQQQLLQRFQPAIEADRSVQTYELQQSRLRTLQSSDQYKAKQPEILKEVEALQKALATDKERYAINKAFLELIKSQSGSLLDQTTQIGAQNKTRQLISAGTPSPFTPASIFDTKGTTATELNNAIQFALKKQQKLEALDPEYKKQFAQDQFLLQSGTNFKGVTGVNQGFVQEALQAQQQQKQAPLEDLSKYSDQELQGILDRARGLQGQAEKLDPSRVGKYEDDRILILRKNNQLLSETGLSQEFLKAAIDANTKSNDTLRGHYNLPSSYKAPTIFDYYDNGGKEKGDQNFPTQGGNGLVSLDFAQQLARELANPTNNDGADLSEVGGTRQPGSRPLFHPQPGTAAVYAEVEPLTLPETIKFDDKPITDAVKLFYDFKQRQVDDFNTATQFDSTDDKQSWLDELTGKSTPSAPPSIVEFNKWLDELTGISRVPVLSGTADVTAHDAPKDLSSGGTYPNAFAAITASAAGGSSNGDTFEKLSVTTTKAHDAVAIFNTNIGKASTAIGAVASALPTLGLGAQALATGTIAFTGAVASLIAKVSAFDLAKTLQSANIQMTVTVNGQTLPKDQTNVTVGTSTLGAGGPGRGGSKVGSR